MKFRNNEEVQLAKAAQRSRGIAARNALTPGQVRAFSRSICQNVLDSALYRQAGVLLSYRAVGHEADLSMLDRAARADGKTVAYPVCLPNGGMTAAVPLAPDAWVRGALGIWEPDLARAEEVLPGRIDLVLTPCAAFDRQNRRVGMGGGYYDRYLPQCTRAVAIGVAFSAQRVEEAAFDARFDVPLYSVVTELSGAGVTLG